MCSQSGFIPPIVLEQYCKLKDQMEEKQYYSALKTLEQLEHTYLPRIKNYFFSELLGEEIPLLRTSIEDQSKEELTVSCRVMAGCEDSDIHTCTYAGNGKMEASC